MMVRLSPLNMHILKGEHSLCLDAEEFPEKKTTADFAVRGSVVFKQRSIQLQGSNRTCRSLTTKTNNMYSLNSFSAPDPPQLNCLQQLTARSVAVSIRFCVVIPLGPALRN